MDSSTATSGLAASRVDDDDEVATLRAENGFLEDQLQRALKELRVYQQQAAKVRPRERRVAGATMQSKAGRRRCVHVSLYIIPQCGPRRASGGAD